MRGSWHKGDAAKSQKTIGGLHPVHPEVVGALRMDCGGKSDATPLSPARHVPNTGRLSCARKRRRRFALPAQSKAPGGQELSDNFGMHRPASANGLPRLSQRLVLGGSAPSAGLWDGQRLLANPRVRELACALESGDKSIPEYSRTWLVKSAGGGLPTPRVTEFGVCHELRHFYSAGP